MALIRNKMIHPALLPLMVAKAPKTAMKRVMTVPTKKKIWTLKTKSKSEA